MHTTRADTRKIMNEAKVKYRQTFQTCSPTLQFCPIFSIWHRRGTCESHWKQNHVKCHGRERGRPRCDPPSPLGHQIPVEWLRKGQPLCLGLYDLNRCFGPRRNTRRERTMRICRRRSNWRKRKPQSIAPPEATFRANEAEKKNGGSCNWSCEIPANR